MDLYSIFIVLTPRRVWFKLWGVSIDSTLSRNVHIDFIVKKTAKRLYFLKVLKRYGLTSDHLLHFYVAVIRQ